MPEAKDKWDEVGDKFNEIGKRFKERYDANAAFGPDQQEKMNDALRQMADALDAGFTALGDSLRDPSIRDELKQAGTSIGDALSATFNDVAGEIKKAVRKK
jgi:phage-related minor tail protein